MALPQPIKRCNDCARGWRRDNGNIACGAPVDDDALRGGVGQNPIWAERKYSPAGIIAALLSSDVLGNGMDCENMRPDDGADCKLWQTDGTRDSLDHLFGETMSYN